ncbi:MAG TPA: hypothetical protein VN419_05060 [Humidesulfovibrio sp.]|uniref:hypothetical protein n=1 Tax=Humidesulfovibrio sp. TaxID=2910988 RepID=UPI002C28358C|nr:hypothetical protein [Humidesulfovibrio sp.]HWR03369.1 hypothetical protein [Humidesulfovibrio sp.]
MHKGCSGRCRTLLYVSNLWKEGMSVFQAGDAAQGELLQRKALALLAELSGFPVVEAKIRNNLGVILSCSGRDTEARWEFVQALTLLSGRVEPGTRFHQVIANNYAQTMVRRALPAAADAEAARLAIAS